MVENRLEAFSKNGFETVIYASRPTRGLSDKEYNEYKNKKSRRCIMEIFMYIVFLCTERGGMFYFGL